MASKEEKIIFNAINAFRSNPDSVNPTVQKLIIALERLSPNSAALASFRDFAKKLKTLPSNKELKLSKELSQAGHDYLKKVMKTDLEHEFKEGKELKNIIPDNFITDKSVLIMDNSMDETSPDSPVVKLCVNTEDPKKLGFKCMTSDAVTQVGIALEKTEDDTYITVIFTEDEEEDDSNFTIPGVNLTELRMAFESLMDKDKKKIKIKEVLAQFEEEGRDKRETEIYNLLKELDKGNEYVTWTEFATHCHKKMTERNNDRGLQRIFKILLPNQEYVSVDYAQLVQINKYLKLGYSEDDIKNMLKLTTTSNYGVDFEDFKDRVKNYKGGNTKPATPSKSNEMKRGRK